MRRFSVKSHVEIRGKCEFPLDKQRNDLVVVLCKGRKLNGAVSWPAPRPSGNYGCAHAAHQACRDMDIPALIDAPDCVGDIDEKSLCLQLAVMRRKLCLEAQLHRPFLLLMRHGNKKMAVTAQLFTFGAQEGGWVTVIDSWKQQGMIGTSQMLIARIHPQEFHGICSCFMKGTINGSCITTDTLWHAKMDML